MIDILNSFDYKNKIEIKEYRNEHIEKIVVYSSQLSDENRSIARFELDQTGKRVVEFSDDLKRGENIIPLAAMQHFFLRVIAQNCKIFIYRNNDRKIRKGKSKKIEFVDIGKLNMGFIGEDEY